MNFAFFGTPMTRRRWAAFVGAVGLPTLNHFAHAHETAQRNGENAHSGHHDHAQLAVGTAFSPGGDLWIVALNDQGKLFVQRSDRSSIGKWQAPKILDTGTDTIAADGESRPSIAFGPNGWVVVSYTQPLSKPYTGMIRMLRSSDGGNTFSEPFTVHQDRQEITHRFQSIAFDASGALHTLWIDKRDQPPQGAGLAYAGAAVYRNVSKDGGVSFGPDIRLVEHSCECCRIALARGPEGRLRALWRHVFDGQIRDHAFASLSDDGPQSITRATFDDWHINACPHHGPGLALATDSGEPGYHAVWFGVRRMKGQDVGSVHYSRLKADGTPIEATERTLPDPRAEHADVLADANRVVVVWRSTEGDRSKLKVWMSRDGGANFAVRELAHTVGNNDHPRLAQFDSRMFVVWRTQEEIGIHEILV